MNIQTFYVSKDGSTYLSDNFKVSEFACTDGTDELQLDVDGVYKLQKVRTKIGSATSLNSAFRTKTKNAECGGATNSYHLYGRAFDCVQSKVSHYLFAKIAEVMGFGGTIVYPTFCHVDTRDSNYFATSTGGSVGSTNLTQISYGSSGQAVKDLQTALSLFANAGLTVDGKFGSATKAAVMAFQTANNLVIDGICGKLTWTALLQ